MNEVCDNDDVGRKEKKGMGGQLCQFLHGNPRVYTIRQAGALMWPGGNHV